MKDENTYFSHEAVKRMPAHLLKNLVELIEYQNDLIERIFHIKNNISHYNEVVYILENDRAGVSYYQKILHNGKFRCIEITTDFYFKNKTYFSEIDIYPNEELWGGGEGFIMLFDYIYEKNPLLMEKVSNWVSIFEIGMGYKGYKPLYRRGLRFNSKKDKKRIYAFLKEAIEWVFTQEEIIEVLKGNKWLEGYCPPHPRDLY